MGNDKSYRLKFFLPEARVLNDDEIQKMIANQKASPDMVAGDGLWIEVNCPEGSCLDDTGHITIPTQASGDPDKGFFLKLFCPEDSCEVVQNTDLP